MDDYYEDDLFFGYEHDFPVFDKSTGPEASSTHKPEEADQPNTPNWPLPYRLSVTTPTAGKTDKKTWWSHLLYHGPNGQPVKVLYSRDLEKSESIAKQFLNSPIVGFDMEWPWDAYKKHNPRLQDHIGLIQLACEDKIGLFHVGLHIGNTPEELVAPTLKKIIESPDISKTGVAVLNADMARLARWFKLKPKGVFELSHLHRLVTFGAHEPELVTTKLIKLATLVETHLGLPLSKDSVRTSNWSKPLNQKQREYAAADAYAGFMLYHCVNAKRLAMDPVPPLPLHADRYLPMKMPKIIKLRLQPTKEDSDFTSLDEFYASMKEQQQDVTKRMVEHSRPTQDVVTLPSAVIEETLPEEKTITRSRQARKADEQTPLDSESRRLYDLLCKRRRMLGDREKCALYLIAHNTVLDSFARKRPTNEDGLLGIRGLGKRGIQKYGADWLEVIQSFTAASKVSSGPQDTMADTEPNDKVTDVTMSVAHIAGGRRTPFETDDRILDSSSAFGSPLRRPPALHTGISFSMAQSSLGEMDNEESQEFRTPTSGNSPPLKRKSSVELLSPRRVSPAAETSATLSPKARILRNKLDAYGKRIASMMETRPVAPLLSSLTLDHIVRNPPNTDNELQQIPGIDRISIACAELNKDLLGTIQKFAASGR